MSYKKYCILDKKDNFIEAFDLDQVNSTTVYAVPPTITEDVVAQWRYPGWSIQKKAKKENLKSPIRMSNIRSVASLGASTSRKPERKIRVDAYCDYVNYYFRHHFETRLIQYREMVVLCFEKYEIPKEFSDYYPVMVEYLEQCKNYSITPLIITGESESSRSVTPYEVQPEPSEEDSNVKATTERDLFEVNYDVKKMFPKMMELDINTPRSINFFHEYILKQNNIEAHSYEDVSEIDS